MEKLILVFRGHIRTAFDNTKIIELVELLNKSYNVEIYMQTWDKKECENTWRNVDKRLQTIDVTEDMIYNYFDWLNKKISLDKSFGPSSNLIINLEKFLKLFYKSNNLLKLDYDLNICSGRIYGESDFKIFLNEISD